MPCGAGDGGAVEEDYIIIKDLAVLKFSMAYHFLIGELTAYLLPLIVLNLCLQL